MEELKLLELGFKNTSYVDEENNSFTEFTLEHEDGFKIQISGLHYTEIYVEKTWIKFPCCQRINDVIELINLFKLPF